MYTHFDTKEDLARYFDFHSCSDLDDLRLATAWALYVQGYKGDGVLGCVAEVLSATTHSVKTTVSNTGKVDCFIKYRTPSGAVVPVSCERKTNGGRIETVASDFSKAERMQGKYVVYSLDICNSSTSGKRRLVPAVVIPRQLFIEKLLEFNAVKAVNRNGQLEGYGIQASNKQLYLWLLDYPIVYDRNAVYSDEDFEGLF